MSDLPAPLASEEEVVYADVRPLEPIRPAPLPVAQAAAVAATSFVAGVATLAVAKRRSARRARRRGGALSVVGSRSFLVDIHLLDR